MVFLSRKAMFSGRADQVLLWQNGLTQTVSSTNLFPNPTFEAGTAGWSPIHATLTTVTDARPGSSGSQALNVETTGTGSDGDAAEGLSPTSGKWYEFTGWAKILNVDPYIRLQLLSSVGTHYVEYSSRGIPVDWFKAGMLARANPALNFRITVQSVGVAGQSARLDDVFLGEITLNEQESVSSSNMQIDIELSSISNPFAGQRVYLFYRIQDTLEDSNNCWVAGVVRNSTNDDWDAKLWKVTNNAWSEQRSVIRIGNPESIRVVCHGTTHAMYTKHSGEWIQRGNEVDDAAFQNETGVNIISSEGVTIKTPVIARVSNSFEYDLSGSRGFFIHGDSKSDPTDSYGEWDYLYEFFAQRQTKNNFVMVGNIAEAGWRVLTARTNIDTDLAAVPDDPAPEFILINFGANDCEVVLTEEAWKADYTYLLEAFHTKWPDAKIYVMFPWRRDNGDILTPINTLCSWLSDLIDIYDYVYAGPDERIWFENGDDGETYTLLRGVHYNTAGQVLCAKEWVEATL